MEQPGWISQVTDGMLLAFYDFQGFIEQHFVRADSEKHGRKTVIISEYRRDIRVCTTGITDETKGFIQKQLLSRSSVSILPLSPNMTSLPKLSQKLCVLQVMSVQAERQKAARGIGF